MSLEEKEGIVLKSFPYQENKRIISLFTEEGLFQLLVRLSKTSNHLNALTTPLAHGLFIYKTKASQLHEFQEASLISSHDRYLRSYTHLESAQLLTHIVLVSHLTGKPTPLLYRLLWLYLKHLPSFPHPKTLVDSFILKTLYHEGLLALDLTCSRCHKEKSQTLHYGACYCPSCTPQGCPIFEKSEWEQILILTTAKQIQTLKDLPHLEGFHEKTLKLFKERFE